MRLNNEITLLFTGKLKYTTIAQQQSHQEEKEAECTREFLFNLSLQKQHLLGLNNHSKEPTFPF